ncbi:hypothetical protein [Nocardia sp. CNY236]|uniref:hypothetical protein n=1 Tax=Nocardia sp. CNY236 TaxID=1169152 RepID=UPI00041DF968|nr:hypothetical protein [Nocardia sp. CNY236]
MNLAETLLPTVELMAMPVRDYQVVATSLGHDFKNIGVPVTRHGLPPHTRVHLDERDAYEILLYYVMCWFWSGLSESWFAGDATAEFHLMVNRLCMKVLRATAMLDGAYRHHGLHMMSPYVADRMRAELAWRTAPLGRPADPGRFWSYLNEAFRRFDAWFGRPRPDLRLGRCPAEDRSSRGSAGIRDSGSRSPTSPAPRPASRTWVCPWPPSCAPRP